MSNLKLVTNEKLFYLESNEIGLEQDIKELQKVAEKLGKLQQNYKQLQKDIINRLGHNYNGQKSYNHGQWTITCSTPTKLELDKKTYECVKDELLEYNPVKETIKTTYTVNRELFEYALVNAPSAVRSLLIEIITESPTSEKVTVKANTKG